MVKLEVAGQSFKVVTSAPEEELRRLAAAVDAKMAELGPRGRAAPPQAMLMAALALAHEVEAERARRESVERRTRDVLRRALVRIDSALEEAADAEVDAPAS